MSFHTTADFFERLVINYSKLIVAVPVDSDHWGLRSEYHRASTEVYGGTSNRSGWFHGGGQACGGQLVIAGDKWITHDMRRMTHDMLLAWADSTWKEKPKHSFVGPARLTWRGLCG